MTHLQNLDYVAIVIYLLLMAGIGLFFKWFVKDVSSYIKGSGAIPWVAASISNFMGLFSTFVFVAYAGIAYEHGMVAVTVFWCTVIPCIVASLVFAKRWRRLGISTPIEYLEKRFSPMVRQTIGWLGVCLRILDNTVRLYAIGIFLTAVTPLSLPVCLIISSIIVVSFTLFGGLWAVSIMSTVQFVILMFTSIILFWLSLNHVGGFEGIASKIPDHLNWFNGPKGQLFWLSVYYLMIIIKYNENWMMIQRFYSVKDERAAQKVGYLSAALFFLVPVFFMVPPIVARISMPDLPDKEMAYAAISNMLLPPGMMGIMIASMFAATMSSLNSEYNVIASVLSKDVYQRLIDKNVSEKKLLRVAQVSTVLVGLIVLFGSLFIKDFGGAFEANKLFTGIFAIPIGVPLIMGVLNKKAGKRGALATVLLGSATGLILNSFPDLLSWEMATAIEIIVCFSVYFISSELRRKGQVKKEVLDIFEKLATPIKNPPQIDVKFSNSLRILYIISLLMAAILFISMGLPSINELSGLLSVSSGGICIVLGILVLIFIKKK